MTLGEKIFRLRTEQGLSQETFGEKLGVSRQSVSKWETDQSVPELDKIVAISELFEVTTDYLLKETEETYGTAKEEPPRTEEYSQGAYYIGRRPHYEYKSKKMIGNLPLVHINLGLGIHRAKGVIAIGASAHGAQVAVGDAANGKIALGYSRAVGDYTQISNRQPFDYESACRAIDKQVSSNWLFFKTWAKAMVKWF